MEQLEQTPIKHEGRLFEEPKFTPVIDSNKKTYFAESSTAISKEVETGSIFLAMPNISSGDWVTETRSPPEVIYYVQTFDIDAAKDESLTPDQRLSLSEKTASDRIELLARKYIRSQLDPEENARLAILTERIRTLFPRVTEDDFNELERMLEKAEKIGEEDVMLRQKLDLNSEK